jgi:TetR/AcrR family transcriptional regulator, mexJK operon transcriptional repressor
MTPPVGASTSTDAAQRRSTRKRRAILETARTLFLRNGYLATSMDEIAACAAVC